MLLESLYHTQCKSRNYAVSLRVSYGKHATALPVDDFHRKVTCVEIGLPAALMMHECLKYGVVISVARLG